MQVLHPDLEIADNAFPPPRTAASNLKQLVRHSHTHTLTHTHTHKCAKSHTRTHKFANSFSHTPTHTPETSQTVCVCSVRKAGVPDHHRCNPPSLRQMEKDAQTMQISDVLSICPVQRTR